MAGGGVHGAGKWMDGWETRRRREAGDDWCIIRLGVAGIVRGVDVETTHFKGNFPEACAIDVANLSSEVRLKPDTTYDSYESQESFDTDTDATSIAQASG